MMRIKDIGLLILLFINGIRYSYSQSSTPYVIVIGIDGLSAWGLKKYAHPVMDSLMANGIYSLSVKAVTPTLSAPNWASILTGVKPEVHRIKSNDWKKNTTTRLNVATIFHRLNEYNPSISQYVFYQWKEFEQLIEMDTFVYKHHCNNEQLVFETAAKEWNSGKPKFMFIHIDNVDSSGHNFGQRSKQYKYAIERADSLIGTFINKIDNSDEVYFLITSDHGFWGKHHGGKSKREKNIPWIVTGPAIKRGHHIKERVNTEDVSSVIFYLLSHQTVTNKGIVNKIFD